MKTQCTKPLAKKVEGIQSCELHPALQLLPRCSAVCLWHSSICTAAYEGSWEMCYL